MNTLTITRPDDWHLHLRDGAALESVLPYTARQFARAIVMPNLKPPVTTVALAGAYRDRILRRARPNRGRCVRAAHDALPDRQHVARRDRRGPGERLRARGEVLPGRRDDQLRLRRHLARARLPGARRDGEARPAAARARRGDGSGGRRLRPREGVHRHRARRRWCGAFRRLRVVFEHITTQDAADYVLAAGPRIARHDHRAPPALQPQRDLQGRLAAASLLPAGAQARAPSRRARARRRPAAARSSSSAPTARRTRAARRRAGAAARAASPRTPRSSSTRRRSTPPARSSGSRRSRASTAPDFYRLPRNAERVTLVRERWEVPRELALGATTLVPLRGGEALGWRLA